MPFIPMIFKAAVGLVLIVGSGAIVAGPISEIVDRHSAAIDLSNVVLAQTAAESIDGLAAVSLESMTNDDILSLDTRFRAGGVMAYSTNLARTHYVAATQTKTGVLVSSDEKLTPILCAQLDSACLNAVTTDPELLSAAYEWRTF